MPIKARKHNLARVWRKVSSEPVANTNNFFTEAFGFNYMLIEKNCSECIKLLPIDYFYAKSKSKRKNQIPSHPEYDFESVCIECWDNRKKNNRKNRNTKEVYDRFI
jgi:hypothetical protein